MNLRRTLAGLIGFLALGVGLPTAAGGPVLIGGSLDGTIYDVDPATGLASNPRDTGFVGLSGLAFSTDGVLYGRTHRSAPEPNSLLRIDPVTGNSTRIGSIGLSGREFDFDPITSLLFGTAQASGAGSVDLYSLDAQSLILSFLGRTAIPGSLTINASGDVYVLNGRTDELFSLDRDGTTISTLPLGLDIGPTVGTAFAPDGMLFIVDGNRNATGDLHMFDISSGTVATIGSTGLENGLTSLAYVPEPTTFVLLGLLGVVLAGKARGRVPGAPSFP